jgi:hypothetical protein
MPHRPPHRFHLLFQQISLLTLADFLAACTKNEIRGSVEEQHVQVDCVRTGTPVVKLAGLDARGVILSPSQWPLEASVKHLFRGDFSGVIDAFNWRFQSSKIPSGALEDLYDAGYVPAYVRVVNASDQPMAFSPTSLVIRDKLGAELSSIDPVSLPDRFQKIDWKKTGIVVAVSVLIVLVIVLAASSGKGHGGGGVRIQPNFSGGGQGQGGLVQQEAPPPLHPAGRAAGDAGADQAILRMAVDCK